MKVIIQVPDLHNRPYRILRLEGEPGISVVARPAWDAQGRGRWVIVAASTASEHVVFDD